MTLMEVFEGTLEIISSAGESMLGGEDFTAEVMDWVLRGAGLDPDQEARVVDDNLRVGSTNDEGRLETFRDLTWRAHYIETITPRTMQER